MQPAQLDRYKNTLLDMRARLIDTIDACTDAVLEEVHVPGEDSKEPSEGLDKEVALEQNQEHIVQDIDEALRRIRSGTYGRCLECGTDIPDERLAALPQAPYCVKCESRFEEEAR